jgi:hypothetical protein
VAFLSFFVKIATFVAVAYALSSGTRITLRNVAIYALAGAGVLALYAGFNLAVMEDARARYGLVVPGVVVEKFSTAERGGTRYIGTRGGRNQIFRQPVVTITGFHLNDVVSRFIVTGSPLAWVIEYRFPCDAPNGCEVRDFVTERAWSRLHVGDRVNVRRADTEKTTGRLDDNPQWAIAFANLGLAAALLIAAGFTSGRLVLFKPREWITVPAVVTAVEPVAYKDATHWRVRFAYFDRNGDAQESADEVVTGHWKPGDDCFAVYRHDEPGLATMRVPAR